ncbi:MAG TPA: glycosyltransferase family 1 protein, partial [Ktedonobacterales bacterium]|nr:glycosyltransferase family 1 protein [Ktedonobacterales bacterium]
MRIAIDYTPGITQRAGIGRYTRSLTQALAQVDPDDQFTLFSSEPATAEYGFPKAPNMRGRVVGVGNRAATILWQRLNLPIPAELVMGRADVLHGPDYILPPALRVPRVVTIHDLAFLTNPECAVPALAEYLTHVVPRSLRRADRVIADSQRTADDLVERLNVPPEKIRVIHLGMDTAFTDARDAEAEGELRERLGLSQPFILAVGTIEPRKNYRNLIAAFAKATREPDGPPLLVIAGRKGWLYEGVFAAVDDFDVRDRVRFLDFIADRDLPTLYRAATALAMPSIYEGFGIPVVEAMASGTPVICSDAGPLPEVAGDAALIVPVSDLDALADALYRVATDGELRRSLTARGLARARNFSWANAARAHVAVY